jgi:hypothetical protein
VTPDPGTASRWRTDLPPAVAVVVGSVLLAAPAGLLWSAVAPRLTVSFDENGPTAANLESTKAFSGADGSYLVVMLLAGVLCGVLTWVFARRSGPWAVGALTVGALAAFLVGALAQPEELD